MCIREITLLASLLATPMSAVFAQGAEPPAARPAGEKAPAEKARRGGYFGLFLKDVTASEGGATLVEVTSVFPGSDAARLGFKDGDILVAVNDRPVRNGDQFIQLLYGTDPRLRARATRREAPGDEPPKSTITVRRGEKRVVIEGGLADLDAHPAPGEVAPNFRLKTPDGKTERELHAMLGARPLVLIFGSYT